jgi:hypothetical protein
MTTFGIGLSQVITFGSMSPPASSNFAARLPTPAVDDCSGLRLHRRQNVDELPPAQLQ